MRATTFPPYVGRKCRPHLISAHRCELKLDTFPVFQIPYQDGPSQRETHRNEIARILKVYVI